MISIEKDGVAIDLFGYEKIPLTFQANDPLKPTTFQAGYSVNFVVPFSNSKTFGYHSDIKSTSPIPYQKLTGYQVFSNGIQIASEAILQLNGRAQNTRGIDGFEIKLLLGNKNFFDSISGKTLQDLDLSVFNHVSASVLDVRAAQLKEWEDCYTYPIYWDGQLYTPKESLTKYLYPAVFLRKIWEQIFTDAGYTYTGDFDPLVLNFIAIPYSETKDPFGSAKTVLTDANKLLVTTSTDIDLKAVSGGFANSYVIQFDNVKEVPTESIYTSVNGFYTVNRAGRYKVKCELIFESTNPLPVPDPPPLLYIASIVQTGSKQTTITLTNPPTIVDGVFTGYVFDTGIKIHKLEITGEYQIGDLITISTNIDPTTTTITIKAGSVFTVEYIPDPEKDNLTWLIPENLPPISQLDFIREIMMRYNLIFQTDNYEKKVSINMMGNLSTADAVDLTDKLDWSKIKWAYREGEEFAQANDFKLDGDDIEGQNNPDGILLVADEILNAKKELYTSIANKAGNKPFGAFYPNWELDGDERHIGLAEYKTDKRDLIFIRMESGYTQNFVPSSYDDFRYVEITQANGFSLVFKRRTSEVDTTLGFDFLLTTHWGFTIALLNSMKKLEAYAAFDEVYISNLDFTKLIYIGGDLNSYFYLPKIDQWLSGKLTKLIAYKVNH